MSTSIALARREAALEKREVGLRANARIRSIEEAARNKLAKARAALDSTKESSQVAVATNGAARVGGMALEAYARRKLSAEQARFIGPLAAVGAVAAYTLGMAEEKPANQYGLFAVAGVLEGAASRFMIEQIDRAIDGK